jgi:hypothetical protein
VESEFTAPVSPFQSEWRVEVGGRRMECVVICIITLLVEHFTLLRSLEQKIFNLWVDRGEEGVEGYSQNHR